MNAAAADTRTLGQWAEQAEQAVRALIHRTRPAVGELTDPGDAAEVIAALASLSGMLPQLLDQLARWLLNQQHAAQLRIDNLAPLPDVAHTVHATAGALAHAVEYVRRAGNAIDTAHQHAAHLAANANANNGDVWCQQ